jgi:hypothetical protein
VRFDPTHRAERRTPHFIDTPLKAGCGRRDRVRLITTRSMVIISTPQGSTGYASWRARQYNSTPITRISCRQALARASCQIAFNF